MPKLPQNHNFLYNKKSHFRRPSFSSARFLRPCKCPVAPTDDSPRNPLLPIFPSLSLFLSFFHLPRSLILAPFLSSLLFHPGGVLLSLPISFSFFTPSLLPHERTQSREKRGRTERARARTGPPFCRRQKWNFLRKAVAQCRHRECTRSESRAPASAFTYTLFDEYKARGRARERGLYKGLSSADDPLKRIPRFLSFISAAPPRAVIHGPRVSRQKCPRVRAYIYWTEIQMCTKEYCGGERAENNRSSCSGMVVR